MIIHPNLILIDFASLTFNTVHYVMENCKSSFSLEILPYSMHKILINSHIHQEARYWCISDVLNMSTFLDIHPSWKLNHWWLFSWWMRKKTNMEVIFKGLENCGWHSLYFDFAWRSFYKDIIENGCFYVIVRSLYNWTTYISFLLSLKCWKYILQFFVILFAETFC